MVEVTGDEVDAVAEFEVAPDHLDGIEFGGLGWQVLECKAGVSLQQFADCRPLRGDAVLDPLLIALAGLIAGLLRSQRQK